MLKISKTKNLRNFVTVCDVSQFVWKHVKTTFRSICPESLHSYLHFNLEACRFNVNLINKGLEYHHDSVRPKQPDSANSIPGLTCVVHLGEKDDAVMLEFKHDEGTLYKCVPGTMYVTPGYALAHRTSRTARTTRRRYSIAIFIRFKVSVSKEADKYIHECFDFTNDSYDTRVYTL